MNHTPLLLINSEDGGSVCHSSLRTTSPLRGQLLVLLRFRGSWRNKQQLDYPQHHLANALSALKYEFHMQIFITRGHGVGVHGTSWGFLSLVPLTTATFAPKEAMKYEILRGVSEGVSSVLCLRLAPPRPFLAPPHLFVTCQLCFSHIIKVTFPSGQVQRKKKRWRKEGGDNQSGRWKRREEGKEREEERETSATVEVREHQKERRRRDDKQPSRWKTRENRERGSERQTPWRK